MLHAFICRDFSGRHNREKSLPFCIKDKDFQGEGRRAGAEARAPADPGVSLPAAHVLANMTAFRSAGSPPVRYQSSFLSKLQQLQVRRSCSRSLCARASQD